MPVGVHNGQLKGEDHNMAKLTEEQVRSIRASTERGRVLAELYEVHVTTIWLIRANRNWRHLN